jgi:allantoin racemase
LPAPVIGIGEAAFHLASMLGHRFSVVTTLSRSIAAIENNLLKYGLAGRCAKVRACEVPVLSLDDPASDAAARIGAEIELAKQQDRAEAIVLGCAGMADLAARLSKRHGLPVLDGVASAVKLAEAFGVLGLKTSKIGAYAPPRPKPYLGSFASFEPR